MRLSRYGAKIIVVFLAGGAAMLALAFVTDGWSAWTFGIVGAAWLAGGLIAVGISTRMAARARQAKDLYDRGLRGEATIVEVFGARTATLDAMLDILLPGQAPRRERRQVFVGPEAGHGLQPGMKLSVLADPDDPDDLMIGL
jgi:hypothetical protein